MNNRNTFAAFAMQALIAKTPLLDWRIVPAEQLIVQIEGVARGAFDYADAMMQASGSGAVEIL